MLSAATRLGPYEVVGPIGVGGMGEVYRARDTRLGREVAIKVLPTERLSDPHRRARLVQEARAASALNHPNIVTIYEIESTEGVDFIVMELVPGKTLDALIPRHGMRLGEALRIAISLADALAAAHAAGIVHRDLKPANVMVTPEGVVKVLDFGLAKLTQAEETSGEDDTTLDAGARLSRPGTVAGTPAYMSPEQASGTVVDARSDVFSFGAVLYEMVTGRRPFGGSSSAERLAALLKEQPKPPSELVPEVPKELERIIVHCLRKEPGRRFQHMVDVKVELQELKEESDSQAEAPAGAATATRRSRRRWMAWAAAGFLVLAAAAAVTLWRLRRPELPAATPRPARVSETGSTWQLLARREPDCLPVDGRDGEQLGHLAEDHWGAREPAFDDRHRRRLEPRVVARREADRLRAIPSSVRPRQHLPDVAPGRLGTSSARLSCWWFLLVPQRALARRGEGPLEGRDDTRVGRHLPDPGRRR